MPTTHHFFYHSSYSLSSALIICTPIRLAISTGTAFPICLYWLPIPPANSQSSGNDCTRAYSRIVSGLVSSGWAALRLLLRRRRGEREARAVP